jgi:hypothetical protein
VSDRCAHLRHRSSGLQHLKPVLGHQAAAKLSGARSTTIFGQTRLSLRRALAAAHDVAFLLAVIGVHFHPMINHRSVIDYRWHRPVIVHAL